MIGNQIGKRYAKAIYAVAEDENLVKPIYEILNSIMELYKSDTDFRNFITHPLLKVEQKEDALRKLFPEAPTLVLNVPFYLLEKGRIEEIKEIVAEFVKIDYARNQILDVEATFAVALTEEQKERLIKKLENKTGKQIKLVVNVDKGLIGGGLIKIGDEITDGSIRRQLDNLAHK
ncbi:MAG: ATP synthase F1 subunit delta [Cetobacterium sp.]|uniref:ATP synthase F1 subunit delta n=1 Tax=unclassified Cetobacterium TaxID=2630983 RepID=UPI00163CDA26|nr:ATP synthase F1 subunit delta [Cetobacterium sp. 2A]MBC2856392.1 ATP synthase F1 subunit delta [Cetobacterium sp. 2A]